MKTIQLLENQDILTKGDWCRPLYFTTMSGGMSDDYAFEQFGRPCNNPKWCRVERIMPFWIGGTVGKYRKAMEEFNDWEFVRGDLPTDHIHKNAENPDYDRELADGVYDPHHENDEYDDDIPF